ncbi:NAD-dependent epimerase/dehydratase family protein [Micromonospora globbae]|uniref:NAD-dependent epimerase/dehydratase family protein n=1 Tax=Micromonospora globbae TaxID=1894969 RepID=UPI003866DB41|nr:NAD-dependent epimerase/dehydratase family protein [Micromonospora globbae]
MKIVVTGGAGFIGSNLVRAFRGVPRIDEIVILDDLSTGSEENLRDLDARFVHGSILDPAMLDDAFSDAASVVHLAAVPSVPRSLRDPLRSHHANATGTLMVLEAARRHRVGQVILASSSSVYGRNPTLPKREDLRPVPLSPYAVSKLATEAYAIAYASCFDLAVLPFRFFNVFGPGQSAGHAYAAVVPSFVSAALDGRPLTIDGDGEQTRDFTFVGDVAAVIVDAVLRQVSSVDPVNLAFGSRTSVRRLVGELEDVLGRRLDVVHRPPRAGDVRDSQADNGALRALFPGVTRHTLRQGLEATVAWMSTRVPAGR